MNIAKINRCDVANGEGIRVSLFVSGCKFHCDGCFNSEAWDYNYGRPYTEADKNLILNIVSDNNWSGLSILGGDPLLQDEDGLYQLIELVDNVHKLGKTVWLWTGYEQDELNQLSTAQRELYELSDVVIMGRFDKTKKTLSLPWVGSYNQSIIKKEIKKK